VNAKIPFNSILCDFVLGMTMAAADFDTLECDNCMFRNLDKNIAMIEGHNCPRCWNGRMLRRQR